MKKYLLIIPLALAMVIAQSQTTQDRLANQYFSTGEYEKAAELYRELYDKNKSRSHYLDRYITSLIEAEQYDEADQAIDKQLKESNSPAMLVKKASVMTARGEPEKAKELYRKAIDQMPRDPNQIRQLGYAFQKERNYDLALETFEKGGQLLGDSVLFANQMRSLARYANDNKRLIRYSLLSLVQNNQNATSVEVQLQRSLNIDDHEHFQRLLFIYIQSYPDKVIFPELLEWSYLQQRDYEAAFRQARALDRRLGESGKRIFNLGQMANNNRAYDVAIEAYEYIIEKKSSQNSYYLAAKSEIIRTKKNKILAGDGSERDLEELENEYYSLIDSYGNTPRVAYVILNLARYQNKYLKSSERAKETLQRLINMTGVEKKILANAKLELGDLYLLEGERWESTLLYSQVDKDFPDEELGHIARYRNAMLSYYVGDFEWAQEQFDILKATTHRFISNDAIDRSVFILDNLGLDTTAHPLMMYAEAELKIFQRRYDEAFEQLQLLLNLYDGHGLQDDVYFLKARTYEELARYDEAVDLYYRVANEYPEEIRADNSIYALAKIHEEIYDDLNTAANLYEVLFLDYESSTFSVIARKKYRELIQLIPEDERDESSPLEDRTMKGLN